MRPKSVAGVMVRGNVLTARLKLALRVEGKGAFLFCNRQGNAQVVEAQEKDREHRLSVASLAIQRVGRTHGSIEKTLKP